MKWNDLDSDPCPVARAMSVVGDRWTLLVLRNALMGMRRFDQIQQDLNITRHVLADRLKKLENLGLMRREPYQDRPVRYEYKLTESGKAFAPIMLSLVKWAEDNLPSDLESPWELVSRDSGTPVIPRLTDAQSGQELTYRTVRMVPKR